VRILAIRSGSRSAIPKLFRAAILVSADHFDDGRVYPNPGRLGSKTIARIGGLVAWPSRAC
jgi:hypothetical protein